MEQQIEQENMSLEGRLKDVGKIFAAAVAIPTVIGGFILVSYVADVIQQTKHAYYHIRKMPHVFDEDCQSHGWPDYIYRRV